MWEKFDDRAYKRDDLEELFGRIFASYDDPMTLGALAYELQYRPEVPPEIRGAVIRLLVNTALREAVTLERPKSPEWDFPSGDMYALRRRRKASEVDRDWREVGLLSLSGYVVGKTKGLPSKHRRRILNWVFLEDDLHDIDDEEYAEEWGEPRSSKRLHKLVNSIATFSRNAVNMPGDYSTAIAHWKEDLAYLRGQFYERWHDWPWPDTDL